MSKIIILVAFSMLFLIGNLFPQKPRDGSRYKPIVYDNTYSHNKWGISPEDIVFKMRAYTVSYDSEDDDNGDGIPDKLGIPEWVTFMVKKKIIKERANRPSPWLSEDSLNNPILSIAPKDNSYHVADTSRQNQPYSLTYNLSRGHMCPKNIANRLGKDADYNTHSVLNACPQWQWFNNGIWKDLERLTENWADEYDSLWVICGPVFYKRRVQMWLGEPEKGEMLVAVPDAFFKIIIRYTRDSDELEVLGFIYPHAINQSDNKKKSSTKPYPHNKFLVSINEIERLTGLTFLTILPTGEQNLLKQNAVNEIWDDPGEYNLLGSN